MSKSTATEEPTSKEPRVRTNWSETSDTMLITVLETQKTEGRMTSNSSWHKDVWVAAERALAGTEVADGGTKKTAASCMTRWGAVCLVNSSKPPS